MLKYFLLTVLYTYILLNTTHVGNLLEVITQMNIEKRNFSLLKVMVYYMGFN